MDLVILAELTQPADTRYTHSTRRADAPNDTTAYHDCIKLFNSVEYNVFDSR